MRYPKGLPSHGRFGCCPNEWDRTPNITGLFELDAVIKQSKNGNIAARLQTHCGNVNDSGPLTAYNGYSGYTKAD